MSNSQETLPNKNLVCKNFMYKKCNRNDSCRYIHNTNICFYFWKHGNCKFGTECKKLHNFENLTNTNNTNNTKSTGSRKKNTECFEPMTKPVDMRIVYDIGTFKDKFSTQLTSRDVLLAPNVFNDFAPGELYKRLVTELDNCGIPHEKLLKMWHGNDKIEGTHLIADDKCTWKKLCPTFQIVIDRFKTFFNMNIQATRFNLYKDTSQWKPFHHDKSYIDTRVKNIQNFTVAVSFGVTRDAAFEHAQTKTVISIPQPDGHIYAFANDTNGIWRHGILQDNPTRDEGRISVIVWGWVDNVTQIN